MKVKMRLLVMVTFKKSLVLALLFIGKRHMLVTKFPSKSPVQSNREQSVKTNFLFHNMLLSFLVAFIMVFVFLP